MIHKQMHRLSVDIPKPLWHIVTNASLKSNHTTISDFVRKTLAKECLKVFNGVELLDDTLESIEYLEELVKEHH